MAPGRGGSLGGVLRALRAADGPRLAGEPLARRRLARHVRPEPRHGRPRPQAAPRRRRPAPRLRRRGEVPPEERPPRAAGIPCVVRRPLHAAAAATTQCYHHYCYYYCYCHFFFFFFFFFFFAAAAAAAAAGAGSRTRPPSPTTCCSRPADTVWQAYGGWGGPDLRVLRLPTATRPAASS